MERRGTRAPLRARGRWPDGKAPARAPGESRFAKAIRGASNSRQGGRWINNVRCGIASAIENVLFPAAPVDAFLELLIELLVELDRVRVDARTDDFHGLLEVRRRDLLRVLRLAQCDHCGLAAQALDVRPGIGVEVHGEFFQVHAVERHGPSVDLQDREAGNPVSLVEPDENGRWGTVDAPTTYTSDASSPASPAKKKTDTFNARHWSGEN